MAAIQAAKMKKKVILLEPTGHIGGMMSNGLTRTDASPRKNVYGGLAAAFLKQARDHYKTPDPIRIYFESSWAEATFKTNLSKVGVTVYYGNRILKVERSGTKIKRAILKNGNDYCADVFIDASYEGDLMFKSFAKTILGRESKSQYGESAAGVNRIRAPVLTNDGKEVEIKVDPYVKPGDPKSGLLPGVIDVGQKPLGSADTSLMAYNYRFCITQNGPKVPFTKPATYDPVRYETTARFFAASKKQGFGVSPAYFTGSDLMVAGKYDVNSSRYFSTNVWHLGYSYVSGTEAKRDEIRAIVRNHILGLMWFGKTDPRVPANVRAHTASFGLCADEFKDNGNFPRQMYVRQARRLVGQFVLTQRNLERKTTYPDAIGLGYYPMDEHGMIRTVKDGYIADESRKSIGTGPYQIPYRAMLPKKVDVSNLIVPVAISASHVAYTSIRVEPTYMVLGQAAGAAAALATNGDVSGVNISKLRKTLSDAGQIMKY
ncbi:FAD-dependent oxidoreductase [Pararhizobium gei]|uniref:FAD-dependent oxidoreductase n=1 Tax=Pararhizobium gei TaxID=1395951 RepID=UPI0023DC33B3|nr:FAD-dependent oxidoreductase [Rhizobium gei]